MDLNVQRPLAHLGERFAELGAVLAEPDGTIDVERVTAIAARAVPHAEHCGVTVLRADRPPRTLAATGQVPSMVDLLQYRLRQGPCLDAAEDHDRVVSDDLRTDCRWPAFGPACVDATEVRSMLSMRLWVADGDHAAMNLYATVPGAFQDLDVGVASMFAPFAALAVEHALRERDAENFEAALSSNRNIGVAVGILMARNLMTADQAFDLLRRVSQELNRKLRDIAEEVALTGEVPTKRRG